MKKIFLAILIFLATIFSAHGFVYSGKKVFFNGRGPSDAKYEWVIKNSSDQQIGKLSGISVFYIFENAGKFSVEMTAIRRDGETEKSVQQIEVV